MCMKVYAIIQYELVYKKIQKGIFKYIILHLKENISTNIMVLLRYF